MPIHTRKHYPGHDRFLRRKPLSLNYLQMKYALKNSSSDTRQAPLTEGNQTIVLLGALPVATIPAQTYLLQCTCPCSCSLPGLNRRHASDLAGTLVCSSGGRGLVKNIKRVYIFILTAYHTNGQKTLLGSFNRKHKIERMIAQIIGIIRLEFSISLVIKANSIPISILSPG